MKTVRRGVVGMVLALILVLSVLPLGEPAAAQDAPTPDALCAAAEVREPGTRAFAQAEQVLQDGVDYQAVLCAETGAILVDLFEDDAPMTVNNFVFLAQQGYYNNTTFHRVLPGFMAQGGDPTGTGSGGPGYQFGDETYNGRVFETYGQLAMANAGAGTNGSQFFITYVPTEWLTGNHTIFGQVLSGMPAAEMLKPRDPQQGPDYAGAALNTVLILDDPASVSVIPDPAPDAALFQTLLEQYAGLQINTIFAADGELTGVHDAAGEAAAWSGGNAELGATLEEQLGASGFIGSANVVLSVSECPENAADLPIWLIGLHVSDYGSPEAAVAAVTDPARADAWIAAGTYAQSAMIAEAGARSFSGPATDALCGDSGVQYRVEVPYGRYVLAVDLQVDGSIISMETDPTAEQYLFYVSEEFVLNPTRGTLDRGNTPAQ